MPSEIEEQRRYLGGDSDHTILVKGLDVALLEQNKARAALSTEDDDSLEQAFLEASTEATVPKKRTREDLVRELKEKRGQNGDGAVESSNSKTAEEEARLLEDAKKKGKFKPIGAPVEEKGKKKKIKGEGKDGQRRKKKQKVDVGAVGGMDGGSDAVNTERRGRGDMLPPMAPVHATTMTPMVASTSMTVQSEPEPIEDAFDIFTGAGEYEGIDLGDDDEDEHRDMGKQQDTHPEESLAPTLSTNERGQWFATDDTNPPPSESPQTLALTRKSRSPEPPGQPPAEEGEIEPPTRLVPLQTSALPSIKDFLAMDEAVGALEKRRKRKEKRKGGKGGDDEESKKISAEVRADRDYKRLVFIVLVYGNGYVTDVNIVRADRLKSYTEKKAGTSGTK